MSTNKHPEAAVERRAPYQYSPAEIGEALALLDTYGGNALRTARALGIPRATLLSWASNAGRLPAEVAGIRRRKREEFGRIADEASEWVIASLTQEDIDRAGLRDKSVSYGIFRDKAAQDYGEPTQHVEHTVVILRQAYEEAKTAYPVDEAAALVSEVFEVPVEDVKRLDD